MVAVTARHPSAVIEAGGFDSGAAVPDDPLSAAVPPNAALPAFVPVGAQPGERDVCNPARLGQDGNLEAVAEPEGMELATPLCRP